VRFVIQGLGARPPPLAGEGRAGGELARVLLHSPAPLLPSQRARGLRGPSDIFMTSAARAVIRPRRCRVRPSGNTTARAVNSADSADRRAGRPQPWLKLAALMLVVAALGLPVNDLFRYALRVIATVLVVAGTVWARVAPWLVALAAVAMCVLGQILFAAPRI